jgi:hypothetical protein
MRKHSCVTCKHFALAAAALAMSAASVSEAALTVTAVAAPAGTTWASGAVITTTTTNDPTASPSANDFVTPTVPLVQTITPASTFTLSAIQFLNGGQAGATGTFAIYQIPSFAGGKDTDGFVNTSFSTDLLGGGSGLAFQVFGDSGNPPQLTTFALSGADQITLTAGNVYAIEFDITGGSSFGLLRSTDNEYAGGGDFQNTSLEANFNGTAPANGRGERDAFFPNTDFLMAVDSTAAAPEPASCGLLAIGAVALLRRRRR